ncbi:hypothetical protein DFH09DRAFT_1096979 [Mycena vulgaris]|nr:hypothetical protein DFH09DRAFT_1096979 [Mycena vulgaris]
MPLPGAYTQVLARRTTIAHILPSVDKIDKRLTDEQENVLHPRIKMKYFKRHDWPQDWIENVQDIVKGVYSRYVNTRAEEGETEMPPKDSEASSEIDIDTFNIFVEETCEHHKELNKYLAQPMGRVVDPLGWWHDCRAIAFLCLSDWGCHNLIDTQDIVLALNGKCECMEYKDRKGKEDQGMFWRQTTFEYSTTLNLEEFWSPGLLFPDQLHLRISSFLNPSNHLPWLYSVNVHSRGTGVNFPSPPCSLDGVLPEECYPRNQAQLSMTGTNRIKVILTPNESCMSGGFREQRGSQNESQTVSWRIHF